MVRIFLFFFALIPFWGLSAQSKTILEQLDRNKVPQLGFAIGPKKLFYIERARARVLNSEEGTITYLQIKKSSPVFQSLSTYLVWGLDVSVGNLRYVGAREVGNCTAYGCTIKTDENSYSSLYVGLGREFAFTPTSRFFIEPTFYLNRWSRPVIDGKYAWMGLGVNFGLKMAFESFVFTPYAHFLKSFHHTLRAKIIDLSNGKSETGYVNIASTWESSFGAVFNIPWKEITWDIGLEQNYRAIPDTVPYSGTDIREPSSTYRDTTAYFGITILGL